MQTSVRQHLPELARNKGHSLASLSAMIGRNPAYLQQYVTRGSPKRLDPTDRLHIAMALGVDERLLGARDPWMPR